MKIFDHAQSKKNPVPAIQEDGLKPDERDYLHSRYVNKHKYRMFDTPCQLRHKNAWGGAILLVQCNLKCRLTHDFSKMRAKWSPHLG